MNDSDPRAIVDAILQRVLSRFAYRQMFLFGPTGDPFWAARLPITEKELALLDAGTKLLASAEPERARPFVAHDMRRALLVAALDADEDLYAVVLQDLSRGSPVETRVANLRSEMQGDLPALRAAIGRMTAVA
ncbi:MAG: hypothetical protein IPK71_00870 [Myxococcales bacterium]|nr:hypothetical protein [Myxococcales bacterium]